MAKLLCLPLIIFIFLIFPKEIHSDSNIVINEIMYDLEESDEKREWIELFNLGTEAIDLTSWRFEENGVQHTLILKQGDAFVAGGRFALIVDDYDTFLQDNHGFTGTVFDSSFSLSNKGENLKIRNSRDGNIIDAITYSSDLGASGDGNSLQRKSDGSWVAAAPTPGNQNSSKPLPSPSPTPSSTSSSSNKSSSTKSTSSTSTKASPKESPSAAKSSPSISRTLGEKNISVTKLLPSSTPSASPESQDEAPPSTKVAGFLTGFGALLVGASLFFYFWYYKIKNKAKDPIEEKNSDS